MAETLNKAELVAAVAAASGQSQAAVSQVVDALMETIVQNLAKGAKVNLPGYFSIERTERAARTGRNPATGEPLEIPAGFGVKISAGTKLKAAVK